MSRKRIFRGHGHASGRRNRTNRALGFEGLEELAMMSVAPLQPNPPIAIPAAEFKGLSR